MARNHFDRVAVGGTFDRLHKGHRRLLEKAFEVGEIVVIGLATDAFSERYPKEHPISSYAYRRRQLRSLLDALGVAPRARIVPLKDAFGQAATDGSIEALIVSRETEHTGREINRQRAARGLRPLTIVAIDMILADDLLPISTTRIRGKELDREGHLLKKGDSEGQSARV